ncbi:MAG: cztS [Bacteroidetes bacterium]|nr:cztS [Bacteroidota bacterium]
MTLRQRIRSTRFVLTLWYSIILLAAFILFGAGVYVYLRHVEEAGLEQNLVEEIDWISRLVDLERSRIDVWTLSDLSNDVGQRIVAHYNVNPRNYDVVLAFVNGTILYRSPSGRSFLVSGTILPPDRTLLQSVTSPDREVYRVALRRTDPFIIQVAYSETATETVLGHLLSIFGVLMPVVLFVAFAGGWIMAGMVLRPIGQITRLADRISAKNLSERIPQRDVPDELGQLITTINRMIARLESSFSQIREFSLSVAHELRTPLTILKGESELALARALTREETERLVTTYLEETVRMSRIVDDLLTLAKADAGQIKIQKEAVELSRLLRDIHEDAVILSSDKPLNVELRRNDQVTVLGDEARLRQLFRVLLSNAVQYTDPGGSVSISSRRAGGEVHIDIEDTGIGIPQDALDKVFQRFYRVDEARTRVKGGSGLGLSIAQWIANAHSGSVSVRSAVGKGSCFTVTLPVRDG